MLYTKAFLFTKKVLSSCLVQVERSTYVYLVDPRPVKRRGGTGLTGLLQSWTKLYIKISYLESIFVNSVTVAILPSPFPLEAALLCLQKKAWSPGFCRKQLWTGGRGILYAKPMIWKKLSCVMRINEKTFSSSFVGIVARLYSGQVISVAERTSALFPFLFPDSNACQAVSCQEPMEFTLVHTSFNITIWYFFRPLY